MSRWFRFYAEAMRNPKVMRLSDKDFRLWVGLMAVASENDGVIPENNDLKMVLGMRLDHLQGGLNRLISGGLIDVLAQGYEPHNWSKFQYKSDTSTERVTKHRAKRNVTVTPPETDTETEVVNANALTPRKRAFAVKGNRLSLDWQPEKPLPAPVIELCAQWPPGRLERELDGFRDYWTSRTRDAAKSDWDKAWWNRIRDQHDRVMKENRHGRQLDNAGSGLRGTRPDPCLELLRQSRAELEAEERDSGQNQEHHRGTRPALPAIGAG